MKQRASISTKQSDLVLFTGLVLVLCALICTISYTSGSKGISMLSVFTPSISAFALTALRQGKKGVTELFVKQVVKPVSLPWLLVSLLGIPALASVAVLTSTGFELAEFKLRTTQLIPQVIVILLIALGEEFGWRAYLLPGLMNKMSLFRASILVGLIWGLWHFPGYLIGVGVPEQMNFGVFLLWVVLGSLFFGWIYYYTRSVLSSILVHVGANAAFNYLPVLPEFTGSMEVFWILMIYLAVVMFVVYLMRRKDLISP